jgi:glyoxylase-like metal-dependent hydrolase (beta-lactamase superfamily II)
MKVGSARIMAVLDATARTLVENAVTHPDGRAWDCPEQPADEHGNLQLDFGGFLIHLGDRTALVDLGIGEQPDPAVPGGQFLHNLRRAGVEPGEVTDVFFTHGHADHVGWASLRGVPVFPNATIHVHAADWAHFVTGPTAEPAVRDLLLPVESQTEFFDAEAELIPGLIARPAPGHTPGSTIYLIDNEGERALLLGDTTHTVGELTEPEWLGMWDVDPLAARAMRQRIAAELADTGDLFAAGHFPNLAFGRLVTAGQLRKFSWVS